MYTVQINYKTTRIGNQYLLLFKMKLPPNLDGKVHFKNMKLVKKIYTNHPTLSTTTATFDQNFHKRNIAYR